MKKTSKLLSRIPLRVLLVLAFLLPIIVAVGIAAIFSGTDVPVQLNTNNSTLLWLIGLTLLIAITLGIAIAQWILHPVLQLTRAAKAVAMGNLEQRISLDRVDELGTLANAFNGMTNHVQIALSRLSADEQKYRSLFQTSKDAILITSPEGDIQDINEAGLLLFGYAREEFLQINIRQLYTNPQDRTELLPILNSRGFLENVEIGFKRKGGEEIVCQVTAVAHYSSHGELAAVQSHLRDISRQKKILQAMQTSETRVRSIFYAMTDGLITFDANGQINDINPAAEKLFDYTAGEIIGQKIETIIPALSVGNFEPYLSNYLETAEENTTNIGFEIEGRRQDNAAFPVELALSMFFDGDQQMFVGIVRHIAGKKSH